MTVTKRKQPVRDTGDTATGAPVLESGMQASCDSCSADITHNVHVRCAQTVRVAVKSSLHAGSAQVGEGALEEEERATCPDFDLCVPCFLAGTSLGPHKCTHAYRIISSHSFPIFTPDWGADEELALIEGAELYGLGNWADMADHVGGRTKEECEMHYERTYVRSETFPLPDMRKRVTISQEEFQSNKKARLEELQSRPLVLPPPKPLASAPTCHEVAGFMPGRLEFETEYENEAETLVKDMEFAKVYKFGGELQPGEDVGEEEDDEELELKLAVLEVFNERYDKRVESKELLFDRGLLGYKQLQQNERKKSKEERDLILRTKVFARIQTGQDHESFVDGLLYELALRKRISELQEYRRMGVTSIAEGERYDHARSQRMSAKQANYRDAISQSFDRSASFANRQLHSMSSNSTSSSRPSASKPIRPSTSSLTLANSSSLHLLTTLEQQLCSTLRILPKPYLFLKEALLREWVRRGGKMGSIEAKALVVRNYGGRKDKGKSGHMEQEEERQMMMADGEWGEKVERVWEFLVDTGGLRRSEEGETEVGRDVEMANGEHDGGKEKEKSDKEGTQDEKMQLDEGSSATLRPVGV